MNPNSRIYVAGHHGLVGSALVRCLKAAGFTNLLMYAHTELDLCDQSAVNRFFARERPDYVFLAAAKVGGIYANESDAAEFIRDNLLIQTNVIDAACHNGCKRFLFLGSSCIYPRLAPQPIREEYLLTGPLEATNECYAVAKIAGIKMCQAYHKQYGFDAVLAMPTNLYGSNDNYDLESSHVLPALIRKFHLATLVQAGDIQGVRRDEIRYGRIPDNILVNLGLERAAIQEAGHTLRFAAPASAPRVVLWGSGSPYREFLHADDLAAALLFLMRNGYEDTARRRSYDSLLCNIDPLAKSLDKVNL